MVQIAWAMQSGDVLLKKGTFDGQTNWQWSLQTLLHGLEFLFKCHLKPAVFVAQVPSLSVPLPVIATPLGVTRQAPAEESFCSEIVTLALLH